MKQTQTTISGLDTITVGELIDALSKFDRDAPVEIPVSQYNKSYAIGYLGIDDIVPSPFHGGARIQSSLMPYLRTSEVKSQKAEFEERRERNARRATYTD